MSRARERREAARMKRQVPNHFPDAGNMVAVDDTEEEEQFDWMDVEAEDDEPAAQGVTE